MRKRVMRPNSLEMHTLLKDFSKKWGVTLIEAERIIAAQVRKKELELFYFYNQKK